MCSLSNIIEAFFSFFLLHLNTQSNPLQFLNEFELLLSTDDNIVAHIVILFSSSTDSISIQRTFNLKWEIAIQWMKEWPTTSVVPFNQNQSMLSLWFLISLHNCRYKRVRHVNGIYEWKWYTNSPMLVCGAIKNQAGSWRVRRGEKRVLKVKNITWTRSIIVSYIFSFPIISSLLSFLRYFRSSFSLHRKSALISRSSERLVKEEIVLKSCDAHAFVH